MTAGVPCGESSMEHGDQGIISQVDAFFPAMLPLDPTSVMWKTYETYL